MQEKSVREVRGRFADYISRIAYGGERFYVTRRGKRVAAIVPVQDIEKGTGQGSDAGKGEVSR
ncbi:MAG TPA: type II toxin-antitoxin system Phd/YefM family antitoxin [Myxococcales bacterium]|jgi:prevent-host-death family protein